MRIILRQDGEFLKVATDHAVITSLNADLADLVDEDTQAFTRFMKAMKLPKDTEQEKLIRAAQMRCHHEDR